MRYVKTEQLRLLPHNTVLVDNLGAEDLILLLQLLHLAIEVDVGIAEDLVHEFLAANCEP